MPQIVLASSSAYRRAILDKLNIDYTAASPEIDESHSANESPAELVARLSCEKAQALSSEYPNALIIGSDQVAIINNEIIGKPGNFENAFKQLTDASGQTITFLTGLTLLNS